MSFVISDEFLDAARMSVREMAMEVAVILYRKGNLPLGEGAEIAGMREAQFAHLLASRDVPLRAETSGADESHDSAEPIAPTELTSRELAVELALELYRREKLSLGKAAEVAGLSRFEFGRLLGERGLYLTLDVDDLEQDLATMRSLGLL